MSIFTIVVNILFFVSVLTTIIIQRNKLNLSEVQSPKMEEELPESELDVSRNGKTLITSIIITWIMFNIASFQFTRISSSDPGIISTVSLIALVVLNILFLGGFIFTVITKSKFIVAISVILWLLSNIFIQFIAAVIVFALCVIGGLILLSSESNDDNKDWWVRPTRSKRKPIDDGGGWYMQQEDNDPKK